MTDVASAQQSGGGLAMHRFASRPGLVLGCLAGLTVLFTLGDPGLSIDEPLDVRPGRTYLATLQSTGWRFFSREVVERVFRDNAEHPPLGRWLLGVASVVGEPLQVLFQGADPTGLYVTSGRLAPALAFALLVGIVAAESNRRWGRVAGFAAGWSLLVMPRVFAHAHFAALDTFLSLFWTASLIAGARALGPPCALPKVLVSGMIWSLGLLTKIHAWLLLPFLMVWAFVRLPWRRALLAISLWTLTGVTFYVAGWPWLWYDTLARWRGYWGTSVARASLFVQYFGQVVPDRNLPWHYPWFYFAVTVPVGLQCLGIWGLVESWQGRRADRFPWLLVTTIAGFLALFSTRVPVYDGERLFLHVFPAWAMIIGLGFSRLWQRCRRVPAALVLLGGILLAQAYGTLSIHPFGLSYYNLLTGGLKGAEGLGLELTYWGDAVDGVLLDRLASEADLGARAALAPTLYQGQGILTTTSRLARRDVILGDEDAALRAEWLVLSRRQAYWSPELVARLKSGEGVCVGTRTRQRVWLSSLWHFPRSSARVGAAP